MIKFIKARLNLEELTSTSIEVESAINSRLLTYIDDDSNNNTLTQNHIVYRKNIHEKCCKYESKNFAENDARSSSKRTAEMICKFLQQFVNEYLFSLQERYNKTRFENKCRARIGDIVLIKEENVPRMNWKKRTIDKLIFGNDGLVRGVELLVYQSKKEKVTTIKRPVQLVIPFELCDPKEPAETHTDNIRPKTLEATNTDGIR